MRNVCLVGFAAGGHSGIPRYAAMLAGALDEVADEFPTLRLRLLTTRRGAVEVDARRMEVDVPRGRARRTSAGPSRIIADQVFAARAPDDLLHFFDLTGPLLAPRRPFVATLHDASVARGFAKGRRAYKRLLQPWAVRHARAVVANSAFSRDEAIRYFGASPERVAVIHPGPGLVAANANGAAPRDTPYLLYVGTLGMNKNLPFLIRAFGLAAVEQRLLIVGRPGSGHNALRDAITASPLADRIQVVSDADDGELDCLYRGATALVLPSRYEGFGFTPLEAMGRGCPVLASDIPSVREISGSGAMLLPLEDEAAWVDAIRRIVAAEPLRAELRERGFATVSRYSWLETARGVCRVLESVPL